MRIIAGSAKGRLLKSPRNNMIRPTADKVKSAFYSIIGTAAINGAAFLDLYAGTGSMGIEALSRGAERCVFVDRDSRSIRLIQENLYLCGFQMRAEILGRHIMSALKTLGEKEESFNIIYIDPPYKAIQLDLVLARIGEYKLLEAGGLIGLERDRRDNCKWLQNVGFQLLQQKVYGNTKLFLLTTETIQKTGVRRQESE